jgi:alpha-galactosidase
MDPAQPATIDHTKQVLEMFFKQWGFDGVKIDGQHTNAAPPNYNWRLDNYDPMNSVYGVPKYFKMVSDQILQYKPDAVIEICPCGDCMSIYNMQFINQAVASDPESSWQIRTKGKVYKAIIGNTAYYGDHVELSDGGTDFASTIGIGGVPGTKFTYPFYNSEDSVFYLSPEKEKIWKKWISIYNSKMLSLGKYLGGLYDIGFDRPECHVIRKADTMFYAFYAPSFNGQIELRGLGPDKNYRVFDYVNNVDYGSISGQSPKLKVSFKNYLFLEVY